MSNPTEADNPASHGMPFPLFQGPLRNVSDLRRDVDCSVCGQRSAYAFPFADHDCLIRPCARCANPVGVRRGWIQRPPELTSCEHCGLSNPWPSDLSDSGPWSVCYTCLRAGCVAIHHQTEAFDVEYRLAARGLARLREREFARRLNVETTVLETFDDGSQSLGIPLPTALLFELLRTPCHQALQSEYWPWHCGGLMVYVGRWEPEDFNRHAGGEGFTFFAQALPADRAEEAEDMWSWLENYIAWSCVYQCPRCKTHRVYVDAD